MSHNTISASANFSRVRSMPIFSTTSVVVRMPTVSIKRTKVPETLIVSSIVSRVVPCMLLTSARSSPTSALSRVDFPAFVSPTIATGIPFFNAFPKRKD